MADSIAETYKNGVHPNRTRFKINEEPNIPMQAKNKDSEFSDDSPISCLIPSENEKIELKAGARVLIRSEIGQKPQQLSEKKKHSVPKLSVRGSSSNG
jgi:hypothetical protein